MKIFALIAIFAVVSGCSSKPVEDKPDRTEIVGVWECSEFPAGFISEAGTRTSRITIRDDGTCSAKNFPQRSPYRFIDADDTVPEEKTLKGSSNTTVTILSQNDEMMEYQIHRSPKPVFSIVDEGIFVNVIKAQRPSKSWGNRLVIKFEGISYRNQSIK